MGINIDANKLCENVFSNFKKPNPVTLTIALIVGLRLFVPTMSEKVKLNTTEGIIFWGLISWITITYFFRWFGRKKILMDKKRQMKRMNPHQRVLLATLLDSEDKSICLDKNSGDTVYLQYYLFIAPAPYQSVLIDSGSVFIKYVPTPWLVELCNKDPNITNCLLQDLQDTTFQIGPQTIEIQPQKEDLSWNMNGVK